MSSNIAMLMFLSFIIWLIYSDQNREVEVYLCEANGLTTYVNRNKPPTELKLGVCHTENMTKNHYSNLRMAMRRGSK